MKYIISKKTTGPLYLTESDDIIKRHDELYKTIGNAPRERINPETGLPTMMKDGYEMEYSTEGGKKIWKRTARDLRKV